MCHGHTALVTPRRRSLSKASVLLIAVLAGALAASITTVVASLPLSASVAGRAIKAPLSSTEVPTSSSAPPSTPAGAPSCAEVVAALPPRQRLAQLLMVGVDPANAAAAAALVRDTGVGGIFLGGTATGMLVKDGLAPVRAAAALPLAVAVDDEGGRVQRIDALDGSIPSARTMARTMTTTQVRDLARTRGRALRARGVTIDFAPVVDVSEQPAGAVIGDRSFSSDPAVVTRYARAFAEGLRDSGVLPVVKHFPGHGHASGDSHRSKVTTPPLDQLRAVDLVPYRQVLDIQPIAVMVGHVTVPGLTNDQPASLSPATYQLLRTEYRFDGVAFTDDLGAMKAVTKQYALSDAVVLALAAGADVALWSSGGQVTDVLDGLEKALADGRLSPARVAEAAQRVARAKSLCTS